MAEKIVKVAMGDTAYDIVIGAGVLLRAGNRIAEAVKARKVCVVTDENVAKFHLKSLIGSLEATGFSVTPPIILPAGEATKNFHYLEYIADKALSYQLDRHSAIIALGGGVVGDIAGFAASVVLRGIALVQVPTTLMSQVDSSVGGKTGINTPQGKNMVGTFYQPRLVLIDTDTLKTLPKREMKAGYAEVVKYGLMRDPAFFEWVEENGPRILDGDAEALTYAIEQSCKAKAAVVVADPKEEKDIRALLNLGHTFGHALEAIANYDGRLLHGEAVAIGIFHAFGYSAINGLCSPQDRERVVRHFVKTKLMTTPPFKTDPGDMLAKMKGDKKAKDGRVTLVLVKGIGKAFVDRNVDEQALEIYLRRAFE